MLHLEQLYIDSCDGLEQVFGFSQEEITENHNPLCCPSLKRVKMSNCQRLKYVVPTNTLSQGLPPLVSLKLRNCPQLIQVFGPREERDIIGHPILLNLPFLEVLRVEDCPKLESFFVQSQQKEILYFDNVMNHCQLCSTDVGNHEELFRVHDRYSFFSMEKLQLVNLSKEQIIWKDLPRVVTLETLTTLRLYVCKKLRYIFTPSTARSLSQLAYVHILKCEELERIILGKDQVSSSSNVDTSLQPISFPNLTKIEVIDCNNLKSLLPLGSAASLQKLKHLTVRENMKLEQVFEVEDEAQVTTEKEIQFDKLEWLSLNQLPCLIDFCPKGYHFLFPVLRILQVTDCPKMTTGFFIDSKQIVHSITEATEGSASEPTPDTRHDKLISWRRGGHRTLPQYKEE